MQIIYIQACIVHKIVLNLVESGKSVACLFISRLCNDFQRVSENSDHFLWVLAISGERAMGLRSGKLENVFNKKCKELPVSTS